MYTGNLSVKELKLQFPCFISTRIFKSHSHQRTHKTLTAPQSRGEDEHGWKSINKYRNQSLNQNENTQRCNLQKTDQSVGSQIHIDIAWGVFYSGSFSEGSKFRLLHPLPPRHQPSISPVKIHYQARNVRLTLESKIRKLVSKG